MKCKSCGAEIPANSKFCLECGAKVEAAPEESGNGRRSGPMHSSCGNNQTCGGKSEIVLRNGFVYMIINDEDEAEICVTPVSNEDENQIIYGIRGSGADFSCLNMIEDELIFAEQGEENTITAFDVYTGSRRVIMENVQPEAIWIENGVISFVEKEKLYSLKLDGSDFYEYRLDYPLAARIMGYNGKLYLALADTAEVIELTPYSNEVRPMGFEAGSDMIYGIIGNLYYAPADDESGSVLMCRELDSLEIKNGIQDVERLVTAFEQYVLFNRENEPEWSFLWNIQTLRVYKLNRRVEIPPYSFAQALSDYIFLQNGGALYKIPAPVFFQGEEEIFTDKYLF